MEIHNLHLQLVAETLSFEHTLKVSESYHSFTIFTQSNWHFSQDFYF